jgi:DNA-binding SARP family transcriptional activator
VQHLLVVQALMGAVSIGVLGPLQVVVDGRPVALTARRLRTLLTALALSAGEPVSLDRLATVVWGESPPMDARRAVQLYVARLRRLLGRNLIRAAPGGYVLRVEPDRVDALRFVRLLGRRVAVADPHAERSLLAEALDLWRGEAFTDARSTWLDDVEATRLTDLRLAALERRIELDLALRQPADLVAELQDLTARFPLRERFWEQLMTTLHRAGRRADALAAYRRLHRLLVDEVGIEPGPSVQAVQARILSEDVAPCGVNQLPPGVPDLTGRDTELSIVDRLLAAADSAGHPVLVQVTGPPGAGKSALAVTAAQRARGRFPDGQLYASLRGAQADPLDVLDAFLHALGADPDRIPDTLTGRSSLFRSLATGRRLLILLDDATSERQVHPLLPAHPGCAVVIISRILLPGLECMDYLRLDALRADKALELFGRIVGPARAAADSDTSREIVELCDRLPLAIRTAGAPAGGPAALAVARTGQPAPRRPPPPRRTGRR